jgi:filamentous hemagglutinin family protein
MGDGTANITVTGARDVTQTEAQQIVANPAGYYFNVHTQLNPGGAVRGQLTRTQ